jgi:alpha-L-fucosidase
MLADMDWFTAARFGLFIHWDHASQQGYEASWPLLGPGGFNGKPAPTAAAYHASAATFDPCAWDPGRLASLAKAAGMRYAVFTSKHHSGWTSWPSKAAPFTIASSPYGKRGGDLVGEYTTAFRNAGLRVGLYFSLADWSHPDYPAWTDDQRPYRHRVEITDPAAWQRFRTTMKDQLTELLTTYGPIDLLWFDGQWGRTTDEWDSGDLLRHIRSLAPEVVINDRLPEAGDYRTPEQFIPPQGYAEPWETCQTLNDTWAYVPEDQAYKSAAEVIRGLVEVVSRGGNLLLNVGPRGDGSIPEPEVETLYALADWIPAHAESVFDVTRGLEPWQFYGPTTGRGNTLYLHLVGWPETSTTVRGVDPARVHAVTLLSTGDSLAYKGTGAPSEEGRGELIVALPGRRPDTPLPVIRIDFEER